MSTEQTSEVLEEAVELISIENKSNDKGISYADILSSTVAFIPKEGVTPLEMRSKAILAQKIKSSKDAIELTQEEFSQAVKYFLSAKFSENSQILMDLLQEIESKMPRK